MKLNFSTKKQLTLLLLILLNISVVSAKEWKPGFILTSSNDTLRGLIAYSNGRNEWQYCTFKANAEAHEQNFLPSEIKSFTYDSGLRYKSMDLQVGKMKGLCFVRSLVEGVCSLSFFDVEINIDSIYSIYVLENKNINKTLRIPAEDAAFSIYRKRLRLVLKPFFDNNPVMEAEIKKSDLTIKQLVPLFEKYNDLICNESRCVSYAEIKKTPPRFFISTRFLFQYTGVPQRNYSSEDKNPLLLRDIRFHPGVEVAGSMTLLKHYDFLLLNVGLGFSPVSLFTDKKVDFKGLGVTNTLGLEAHWFNKIISPFIEVGAFQLGVIPSGKSRESYQVKKYYLGAMISIGADIQLNRKHSIPVILGYFAPIYNNQHHPYEVRSGRYQIAVGYTFQVK